MSALQRSLQRRYVKALLEGSEGTAAACLDESLAQGVAAEQLYLELVMAAVAQVGERWHQGELNVAQEHLATQIGLRQLERLRQCFRPRAKLHAVAVVTAVQGEMHWIGAKVVADFLYLDGWEVDFLGGDTPTSDLVEFVRQRAPQLVALSVTQPQSLAQARKAVQALKKLKPPPRVLVGGAALTGQARPTQTLGADGQAHDALDAVRLARELLPAKAQGRAALPDYLQALGKRVQALRKAMGWSQQQLADAAKLDRTYISAVEHGKQNLTLGAISKLADALGVPLAHLLAEE